MAIMDVEAPFKVDRFTTANDFRGGVWIALITLRGVQVAVGLITTIISIVALVAAAALAVILNTDYYYTRDQLDVPTSAVESSAIAFLVLAIAFLVFGVMTLATSITFLVFTAHHKSRSKASTCGDRTPCLRYSCDFGWDVALATLWFALFLVSVIVITPILLVVVPSALASALFVATAVLTGLTRKQLVRAAGQRRAAASSAAPPAATCGWGMTPACESSTPVACVAPPAAAKMPGA